MPVRGPVVPGPRRKPVKKKKKNTTPVKRKPVVKRGARVR